MTYYTNQQIAMFFAVAEHRKLSEAARAMYVSQPSLSKTLARLETSLGVRLFDRNPDGMTLTKEGEYLYNNFKSSFNQLTVAIEKARDMQFVRDSTLRVGLYMTAEISADFQRAVDILERFKQEHPQITVYEEVMTFNDLRHHLLSGNLDVIISISYALKNMLDIETRRINHTTWGIAMSESHPLAQYDELDVSKLNGETFLFLSPEETQIDKTLNLERCLQLGFTPKSILVVQNARSAIMAVKKGQGLMLCGEYRNVEGIKHIALPPAPHTPYITAAWRVPRIKEETQMFIDLLPEKPIE